MLKIIIVFVLVVIAASIGAPMNYKLKFVGVPPIQLGGESCRCNPTGDDRKRCPAVKCKTQGLVLKYFDSGKGGYTGTHFKTEAHNNEIDYDWGSGPILNSGRVDGVKLEFTGLIRAPATGPVEFRTRSDDGVRMFIDGQPVIDQWKGQSATNHNSPPIQMVKDEYYPFKLEWYEHGGAGVLNVSWRHSDGGWQVIPSNKYYYNDGDYKRAPKPKPVNYHFRGRQTGANDWGGGNMVYLDRHHLHCGDDGINQFRLIRPRGNQIAYKYRCLEGVNSPGTIKKNTGTNDWGGGNTVYLDRHNVNCGNHPINSFTLARPNKRTVRYNYTCNKKRVSGACRARNTGWNQESKKNIYLDRHNVQCGNREVLTRFQLRRNGKGKFRYDYRCCKM